MTNEDARFFYRAVDDLLDIYIAANTHIPKHLHDVCDVMARLRKTYPDVDKYNKEREDILDHISQKANY